MIKLGESKKAIGLLEPFCWGAYPTREGNFFSELYKVRNVRAGSFKRRHEREILVLDMKEKY